MAPDFILTNFILYHNVLVSGYFTLLVTGVCQMLMNVSDHGVEGRARYFILDSGVGWMGHTCKPAHGENVYKQLSRE